MQVTYIDLTFDGVQSTFKINLKQQVQGIVKILQVQFLIFHCFNIKTILCLTWTGKGRSVCMNETNTGSKQRAFT